MYIGHGCQVSYLSPAALKIINLSTLAKLYITKEVILSLSFAPNFLLALRYTKPGVGITECKKIAAIAEGYYAQMAPHVWGGPVITAAALQIDASIPNFLIQESIYKGGGFFNDLLVEPLVWENGYYTVAKSPGIGVDLNMAVMEKYKV